LWKDAGITSTLWLNGLREGDHFKEEEEEEEEKEEEERKRLACRMLTHADASIVCPSRCYCAVRNSEECVLCSRALIDF